MRQTVRGRLTFDLDRKETGDVARENDKPKLAIYWASSCGGCEEAVVDLAENLLVVAGQVDIVLWPVAVDTKHKDVEKMADRSIDLCLINGAIRTSEQEDMAHLLRRKSKRVVAFGSCAHLGGIPGLANFSDAGEMMADVFQHAPGLDTQSKIVPGAVSSDSVVVSADGYNLTLPGVSARVRRLDQVVDVDYYLPGCPPMSEMVMDTITCLLKGKFPKKGAVLAPDKAQCESCLRRETRPIKLEIETFKRIHNVMVDPDVCFLAQGIICAGPATRSGCGEACINANMPCRGCFGPTSKVSDQGAKLLTALASLVAGKEADGIRDVVESIADPAGTFYRYSLPSSILGGAVKKGASDK